MRIGERYEIGEELGAGGMGTVFKGLDSQTQSPVAIKRLKQEALRFNPERLERFKREGEILRELNHPNIVQVFDVFEEDQQQYLVMEYVSGGDLWALLARYAAREEVMPIKQVLEIGLDLADALTRTHRLNIVHRDLKPGNVLLASDGTPRLTDFGVAHVADKSRMTEPGIAVGTIDYLSPEALEEGAADNSGDIWAFGVMLFEMLTGHTPFSRNGIAPTITAILQDPLPDLEQLRPDCPVALVDLVYRMLERDRSRRIHSVRQVGLELEAILSGDEIAVYGRLPPSETDDQTPAAQGQDDGGIRHNLPAVATSFVGREAELEALGKFIEDPATRLITILGFGGMGKTRLALEFASRYVETQTGPRHFPHGIYFVPLAPLSAPEFVPGALADAIELTFSGADDPEEQLLRYLRRKSMLLVMDNFEHLLGAATLVARILEAAPGVKVIVTSRERLNLHGETLVAIGGMDFPDWETPEDLLEYSGIKLFLQSAQRAQPGFTLDDVDLPYLARISHLVQGMPLGLELAAAWVDTLPLGDIASEIQNSLDFLATDMRDLPERQRSVRAVFDYSWAMLSDQERDLFARLSVFRGGFTRYAAMRITGTTLRNLMTLVNKSLLSRDSTGRFQIHELLHQFAAEALAQSGQQDALEAVHAAYYTSFAQDSFGEMAQLVDAASVEPVLGELDNLRAAWRWAVAHRDSEQLRAMVLPLHGLYQVQGYYLEGVESAEMALKACETLELDQNVASLMVELLTVQGWLSIRLGLIDQARAILQRGVDLMQIGVPRLAYEDPISALALVYSIEGDYAMALDLGNQALEFNQSRGDDLNVMVTYYVLTSAALGQGDYSQALHYSTEALRLADAYNQPWFQAYIHIDLGHIALATGNYAEAKQHYETCYTIRRDVFNDPEGMAVSLRHLGQVALLEGDPAQARMLFEDSLSLYQDLGDRGGLASVNTGLGMALTALGDYEAAWNHLKQALQLTLDIHLPPLMLSALVGTGDLLLHSAQPDEGRKLLLYVLAHPMSNPQVKIEAERMLSKAGENHFDAEAADSIETLDKLVQDLLHRDNMS